MRTQSEAHVVVPHASRSWSLSDFQYSVDRGIRTGLGWTVYEEPVPNSLTTGVGVRIHNRRAPATTAGWPGLRSEARMSHGCRSDVRCLCIRADHVPTDMRVVNIFTGDDQVIRSGCGACLCGRCQTKWNEIKFVPSLAEIATGVGSVRTNDETLGIRVVGCGKFNGAVITTACNRVLTVRWRLSEIRCRASLPEGAAGQQRKARGDQDGCDTHLGERRRNAGTHRALLAGRSGV